MRRHSVAIIALLFEVVLLLFSNSNYVLLTKMRINSLLQ